MTRISTAGPFCRWEKRPHGGDARDVHVWSRVGGASDHLASDLELLDDAERARAAFYRFERDRVRFVRRHAFTRRVLARYLCVDPATIRIRTGRGRPELDPPCAISFNVAQADELTMIAVAQGRRVGVDVERLRHIDDAAEIADGLFAPQEAELLRSMPPASRSSAFLALWTRKESFVKAVGKGLSIPLDGFAVLAQGDNGVGRPRSPSGTLPYAFAQLDGPRGYVGAVTLPGTRVAVRQMDSGMVA